MQIRVLFRNGGEQQRAQARKLLEELVADPKQATPDDLLTLAQLNEIDKNLPAAKELLNRIAGQEKPEPVSIVRMIEFLLRNGDLDEAETWIGRLEAAAPESFAAAQLHAQWLKASNRTDEIVPLLDKYKLRQLAALSTPNQKSSLLQGCAALYAALGSTKAADATYRELYAADPQYYAVLADWLFSQKKTKEAVELFSAAAATDTSSLPALQLAKLMLKYDTVKQQSAAAEKLLDKALDAHPDEPGLLFMLAQLRKAQGRREDSERHYRRLLELNPDNGIAANNLAWMLSERPEGCEEALKLVDKAIEQLGRNPEVLDTKGMILFRQGNAALAVDTLKQATKSPGVNATSYLHLSLAYRDAGNKAQAREQLQTFRRLRPDAGRLTAEEKRQLADLESTLAQ